MRQGNVLSAKSVARAAAVCVALALIVAGCVQAGLPACSAHGLRKAATVRLIEAGCTPHEAAAVTGHESMRVLEIYARERDRRGLADAAMRKLIDKGVKPSEKVPLDEPTQDYGTNPNPKPLKGKRSWKSLAPLRECVSKFMPSAER